MANLGLLVEMAEAMDTRRGIAAALQPVERAAWAWATHSTRLPVCGGDAA